MKISASVVVFSTPDNLFTALLTSLVNSDVLDSIFIIDHSLDSYYSKYSNFSYALNIIYFSNVNNPGYGAGHNYALKISANNNFDLHLVVNPDIYFNQDLLSKLSSLMNLNPSVGLIMPQILYPDNINQNLAKKIPNICDIFFRMLSIYSFFGIGKLDIPINKKHRFYFAPYLSGCFMFIRIDAIKKIGFFDERFFMYPEDIDLSRRIAEHFLTIYDSYLCAYHHLNRESKRSFYLFFVHLFNMLKYFLKWGFIIDKKRNYLNSKIGPVYINLD
jgi:GT2 family glycosyltransferase